MRAGAKGISNVASHSTIIECSLRIEEDGVGRGDNGVTVCFYIRWVVYAVKASHSRDGYESVLPKNFLDVLFYVHFGMVDFPYAKLPIFALVAMGAMPYAEGCSLTVPVSALCG